eukprot:6132581-Prymnesium_polylepis.1
MPFWDRRSTRSSPETPTALNVFSLEEICARGNARVVYVVREPRPDESVAVRADRPGVSRKCSPTL